MSTELHEFQPEEVMAYLDGEVIGARALALAYHLENCTTCSSLADDFRALSEQLIAWTFQPPALLESSLHVDPEIQAQQDRQMVCAEFPDGLPASYEEPRKSSQARSLVRRPWVWVLAGAGALAVILSVQFFRMSKIAPTLSASNEQSIQQDISSLKDRLAQDEKANTDLQSDLKVITDKLKITQGQLTKARVEAGKLNDEASQKVTALDTSVHSELATKASSDDVETVDTMVGGVRTDLDTTRFLPLVGKMIERTASLSLIVKEVEAARAALEEIAKQHEGYFAELNTSGQSNAARTLTASMRVPASELDSTLAQLRKLGQLDEEKQGGEEVSQQYVDLNARLENSRQTEKRLTELLAKRADKLKEVLDVERELASTREEIERMDSEQQSMQQQVNYASIELKLREEYKPALNLGPPSAGTRMRNALVEGYHAVVENALGLVVLLLQGGPSILFWLALVFFPVRWAWRKLRPIVAQKQPLAGAV